MKLNEALETFGYNTGNGLTLLQITSTWKQLCLDNHPDRGGKTEVMALINDARDTLVHWLTEKPEAVFNTTAAEYSVSELFEEILNKISSIPGINITASGSWLWISTIKEYKEQMKEAGCKWSRKKQLWYWRPAEQKRSRRKKEWDFDKIKNTFGSTNIQTNAGVAIA